MKKHLEDVNAAIDTLMELWKDESDPTLLQVVQLVAKTELLEIPEALKVHASGAIEKAEAKSSKEDEQQDLVSERDLAIQAFLKAPFSQIEPMAEYLSGRAHFDTHQGVKGLEFERVMVIMDDEDARGFLFKYEDLFGRKAAGDRTVESTRRLFYVTASRAKESLALVAYSSSPDRVKKFMLDEGWFDVNEIVVSVPS
jgi:DNA helicase-2/ATP-dependent DNA helicase PcrA